MKALIAPCFVIFALLWQLNSYATTPALHFPSKQQEQQYYRLLASLRCLVCQNQSLADSSSSLAQDLRTKTYQLVMNQHSDDDIKQFMASRYGDVILYEPPFTAYTVVLWLLPFGLLFIVFTLFIYQHRQRQNP